MSRINDALTRAAQDGRYALTSDEPLPAPVRDPADTAEPVDVSAADQFPLEYLQQSYVGLPAVPDEQAIRVDEEHLPPAHGPAGATGTPIDVVEKLVIGAMPTASLEQYRRLAAALHQAHLNTGLRIIMIASAVAGEGKTLTSANLALTLSESYRRRVLLIDADLRRPSIHGLFGIPNDDGLTDVLGSDHERKVFTQQVSGSLSVVTSGRPDTNQMAHLTSARMKQLLHEAMEVHDWVVIDTPPVALLPDAKLLGAMVDGALLVVRSGVTPYPIVRSAIQAIGAERILGTVLNGADPSSIAEHSYYSGYGYGEAPRRPRRWRWFHGSNGSRDRMRAGDDATAK